MHATDGPQVERQSQLGSRPALAGLSVLEWGTFITAPYCAKLLADFGAHVVKVEELPAGDPARYLGPFAGREPHPDKSGLFQYLNAGKWSASLALDTAGGRATLLELIMHTDISLLAWRAPRPPWAV
jgi:crotonobetainyl-CoA:carnitine CoA-transferase CaiB-like acyl-CoA transferase